MKVESNNVYQIDELIEYDISNNTLNLKEISSIKVIGKIEVTNVEVIYDLHIAGSAKVEDISNFCIRNHEINFKINENIKINEEIEYLDDRTLDLQSKIWDNIVVDILQLKYDYIGDIKNGDGWSFHSEEEFEKDKLDERLSPLLQLLEQYEEE